MFELALQQVSCKLKALVVGGDSLIGNRLTWQLGKRGLEVSRTSRRIDELENKIYFDLAAEEGISGLLAFKPDIALICVAATNISRCENDPVGTRQLNVTATVRLVQSLMAKGIFVVFLSSNTIFDGNKAWPDENEAYLPVNEYGKQKAEAEGKLLALPLADRQLAIVRLSKVLDGASGLAHDFLAKLMSGSPCRAFTDLLLCPASLSYVTAHLADIAIQQRPGVFHLSGDTELSYADLVTRLALEIGVDTNLVQRMSSADACVEVLFKPCHPGLGMVSTYSKLGIQPEPIDSFIASLLYSNTIHEYSR